MVAFADLTEAPPPPSKADWNDDGVLILPGCFSDRTLMPYVREWLDDYPDVHDLGGYDWPTPYMECPAMRRLLMHPVLHSVLRQLTGVPMALNLCLTGWRTTERNWHQDSYLNPETVGDRYAAVWIALSDIDRHAGPFQYVPGSHRWRQVTQRKIAEHLDIDDPLWPKRSEALLTRHFEREIERQGANVVTYVPNKGDLLVWHGRLLHRGSQADHPGLERRALIAHFSSMRRADFGVAPVMQDGGAYFPLWTRDRQPMH